MKITIIIITLLLSSATSWSQSSDSTLIKAKEKYPMLEECQIPGFPEKTLCGQLMVYENHQTGQGKKIPIDVVVLPAKTESTYQSALTMHWGGNGGAAKDKVWHFRQASSDNKIRSRDIVLIDDRGTGASNIRCAAMDSLKPYSYAFVYDKNLIKDCLNEIKDIITLELYTTPNVVKDYEVVRDWLGVEQFDFYGISYGVRVGLEYMRRFPENVRTLVVQGNVPPGFNYINEMDRAIQEQLDILFERCENDSICNTYYPNFQKELYEIRDRLKKEPVQLTYQIDDGTSTAITMDDLLFRRIVGHQILNGNLNEALPLIIHRAYEGNYAPLIVAGGSLNLDMPVFLSQFCPEEVDRFSFEPNSFGADNLLTEGAIGQEKVYACEWWMEMPSADWLNKPVQGNSPILILTGQYDANTPYKMGEQIREAFPNQSRHLVLPHQGHSGTESACRFNLISQFVETKDLNTLDISCLAELKPKPFAYELPLADKALLQYTGEYTNNDPQKMLKLYKQNGVFYLQDEFSRFTGPSQLLYKGEDTFTLIDNPELKIVFERMDGEIKQVSRVYRETTVFKPNN